MHETCGNIKAILAGMQGKGLSSTAKLVAILEACGITDRAEVEFLLESKPSTIREARSSLKIQRRNSSAVDASARIPAQTPEFQRQNSSDRQNSSAGTVHAIAHANMESSSKISIPSMLDSLPLTPKVVDQPSKPKAPRKPSLNTVRGSRLDRDWQLPPEWRMWARTIFPGSSEAQIDDQAAQFRDYWIAKPGAMACKLDWEATWRNWCRKGLSPLGHVRRPQSTGVFDGQGKPYTGTSTRDKLRRIAAEMGVQ